jgi:hypothetical protein
LFLIVAFFFPPVKCKFTGLEEEVSFKEKDEEREKRSDGQEMRRRRRRRRRRRTQLTFEL